MGCSGGEGYRSYYIGFARDGTQEAGLPDRRPRLPPGSA